MKEEEGGRQRRTEGGWRREMNADGGLMIEGEGGRIAAGGWRKTGKEGIQTT